MVSSNISSEGYNNYHFRKKKGFFGKKFLLFLVFIVIIGVILFTTVYRDFSWRDITGKVTFWERDTSNYVDVSMELIAPELILDGNHEKIIIKGNTLNPILVGNHQFSPRAAESIEIVLEDFSGKINLNKDSIFQLDGRVSKININDFSYSETKGKKIKVSISSPINYESVEFNQDIHLRRLDYITSGNVLWGQRNHITLENEKIDIRNFLGRITFREKKIYLNGIVDNVIGNNFRVR